MIAETTPNIQNHEYYHLSIPKPVSSSSKFLLSPKTISTVRIPNINSPLPRPNQEWIKIVKDGDIYFSWYSDDRKSPVSKVVSRVDQILARSTIPIHIRLSAVTHKWEDTVVGVNVHSTPLYRFYRKCSFICIFVSVITPEIRPWL